MYGRESDGVYIQCPSITYIRGVGLVSTDHLYIAWQSWSNAVAILNLESAENTSKIHIKFESRGVSFAACDLGNISLRFVDYERRYQQTGFCPRVFPMLVSRASEYDIAFSWIQFYFFIIWLICCRNYTTAPALLMRKFNWDLLPWTEQPWIYNLTETLPIKIIGA